MNAKDVGGRRKGMKNGGAQQHLTKGFHSGRRHRSVWMRTRGHNSVKILFTDDDDDDDSLQHRCCLMLGPSD